MRAFRRAAFLNLALLAAGCSDSSTDPGPIGEGIPTDHTDAAGVLAAHTRSLGELDHEAYMDLLDPDFEFHVRPDDVSDFPWLQDDHWDYATETQIIRNMTDPNFQGDELPVQSIELELQVLREEEVDGALEVTANAVGLVLVAPNDGWTADFRMRLLLVPDADGFFRIREIHEIDRVSPRSAGSIEENSWARIKAQYR